jgi:hypothetical protein
VTVEIFDEDGVVRGAASANYRQANLAAALRLAAAGLPIFPVKMVRDGAGEWKKPPFVRNWQEVATTDPVQIKHWWDEFPDAVPGIELEHAGLVVVDTDRHGGPMGLPRWKNLSPTMATFRVAQERTRPGKGCI